MGDALISLGGNVGDVRETFARAIAMICGKTQAEVLARSADYRTPPWGETAQPPFFNACIRIDTTLDPHALMHSLHVIEARYGRDRKNEQRWGPRSLDLDLLAYDDASINDGSLILPHPRLFERAFVLVPLCDIAPDRAINGRTPREALAALAAQGNDDIAGIEKLPDLA